MVGVADASRTGPQDEFCNAIPPARLALVLLFKQARRVPVVEKHDIPRPRLRAYRCVSHASEALIPPEWISPVLLPGAL